MPRRPYRFEDFARSGRFRLLQRMAQPAEPNNEENYDSVSSASSNAGMEVAGLGSDVGSRSSAATSDDDNMDTLELGEGNDGEDSFSVHENSADEDGSEADAASGHSSQHDVREADAASGHSSDGESDIDHEDLQRDHGQGQEDEINFNGHFPLYPGAPITLDESMHMILTFALSHNLSGKCIGDLLQLITLHCIQPNSCSTSLYHFKKYFQNVNMPIRRHYYCSKCLSHMDGDNCNECHGNEKKYFITIPIVPQLRAMFQRKRFYDKLQYRFQRVKKHRYNYEDVYDGCFYQSQFTDGGFLRDPNALSFCWNSDGVPVYKSSKFSIWPFYLRINELPYEDRVRKENIILAALWFGDRKPDVNLFLLPLLPELTVLSNGVEIAISPVNNVLIKARIFNGTCDMPAKACFLNMVSYNGYYGCTACKQRGERTPTNRHVYRYEHNSVMRSNEELENFATTANDLKQPVFGVKGLTVISRMTQYPITGTAIDPMHKYSGLVMKLMSIWFSPEFHDHPASMSQMVRLVDQRLCNIAPPMFVERLPRSLDHLKYFKASELKVFLFSYAIPILHDLFPAAHYFDHFKLLVHGLFLLNQASISPEMILLASELLREFVLQFEDWYGVEHMTCNIHQLLHLSKFTENLGPLFASSCAPFETMNGVLKKYVHGTRYADLQVCTAASLYVSLSVLNERHLRQNGPVHEFCNKLYGRQKRLKLVPVTENVSAADKMKPLDPIPAAFRNALQAVGAPTRNIHEFKKAFFRKRLYVCQSYLRAKKTKSFCIKFRNGNKEEIGIVKNFLRIPLCECCGLCCCPASCFAIVNLCEARCPFSTRAPESVLSFIYECTLTDNFAAVRVEDFITQCFYIVVADINKIFVVQPVNDIESDD